jgi:hypothetical protein
VIVIVAGAVRVCEAVFVQPFASVTVTAYVPANKFVIFCEELVYPLGPVHEKVNVPVPPLAFNAIEPFEAQVI